MPFLHRLRLAAAGRLPAFAKAAFLKVREFDAGARALPTGIIPCKLCKTRFLLRSDGAAPPSIPGLDFPVNPNREP